MTTTVAAGTVFYRVHPGARFHPKRWFALVLVGETAGFVLPGLAWFVVWTVDVPPLFAAAVVVLFGAGEGVLLGAAQWISLRSWKENVSRAWILATALGAAFAWACGMTPSTASDLGASNTVAMTMAIALAPLLLLAMPVAQFLVLRPYVPRAWRWIPWSVFAWIVALPPTFVGPMLLPANASNTMIAATWLGAGLAMAAIVALITAHAMAHLTAHESEIQRP